ncbi:MAG TPA: VIT1/CCC1 transporter family protein [Dehalococcoidia bacterium]|nr:VIT1/CCC1 transporter family protein [Dehalococcoidia bacterium]
MQRTERNLWTAFIDEAKANRMYLAYAQKAEQEGYPEIAQLFREIADMETEHALKHFQTLGEVRSTVDNLRRVVEDEGSEFDAIYPRFISDAEKEGRKDAVASFRHALDGEKDHISRFQAALEQLEKQTGRKAQEPSVYLDHRLRDEPPAGPHSEIHTEKSRIASLSRIREVIFGMQDGLLTTATLGAAVAGATTSSHTVIVAGLASAVGGTFSMAAGSFLGSRAEQQVQQAELDIEAREIQENPSEELAELIEAYRHEGFPYDEAERMAENVASSEETWLRTLAEKELGLSMETVPNPSKDAAAMGASYVVGAFLPLLPFFLMTGGIAVAISIGIAVASLFVMGFVKGKVVHRNPLYSALEITLIGSIVAAAGYFGGKAFPA